MSNLNTIRVLDPNTHSHQFHGEISNCGKIQYVSDSLKQKLVFRIEYFFFQQFVQCMRNITAVPTSKEQAT